MIYFISDHHFGHKNIIEMEQRPFKNVYEMNLYMLNKWNETITNEDTIYYLGDIMYKMSPLKFKNEILNNLNGQIYFIEGNHEKEKYLNIYGDRFIWIKHYYEFNYNYNNKDYFFVLEHYPITSWNRMYRGSIHLHGHNHKIIDYKQITKFNIMNVSVENLNYKPISIIEVIEKFN